MVGELGHAGGCAGSCTLDRPTGDIDHAAYGHVTQEADEAASPGSPPPNIGAANAQIPRSHASLTGPDMRARRGLSREPQGTKAAGARHPVERRGFQRRGCSRAACAAFPRLQRLAQRGLAERAVLKDYIYRQIAVYDTPHGLDGAGDRDADRKGIVADRRRDRRSGARGAKARKLCPDANGGAVDDHSPRFGGNRRESAFTPIVNPPELAILGFTRTEDGSQLGKATLRAGSCVGALDSQLRSPRSSTVRTRAALHGAI